MAKLKAFYSIKAEKKEDVLKALEENYGLKGTFIEDYISIRGTEDSGIETVRLSIEKSSIKVMVSLIDDSLLEGFNTILGEPERVKGRKRRPD